jgi:hypothetical protein
MLKSGESGVKERCLAMETKYSKEFFLRSLRSLREIIHGLVGRERREGGFNHGRLGIHKRDFV